MKIISYNVNGIRAAINKGFIEWLRESNIDVICIQETKANKEQVEIKCFDCKKEITDINRFLKYIIYKFLIS